MADSKECGSLKFRPLTPIICDPNSDNVNNSLTRGYHTYFKALDYALGNDDIYNIAISGSFASGKSSLWRSYINRSSKKSRVKHQKLSDKDVLYVSMANFCGESEVRRYSSNEGDLSNVSGQSNTDSSVEPSLHGTKMSMTQDRIENILINQIANQIHPNSIPLSKYRIMKHVSYSKFFVLILFISSLIYLYLSTFVSHDYNLSSYIDLFATLAFIVIISYYIFELYRRHPLSLSKINLKVAEAEYKNDLGISELDKNLAEVIYLLKNSGASIVVFEDLDRLHNLDIYIKLRELNFIVNKSIVKSKYPFSSKKKIKFIYLLDDGVFGGESRRKYFDFIISIVPVMDSYNSESILMELMNSPLNDLTKHSNNLLSGEFISKISGYINDMRLVNSVINEFNIYYDIMNQVDLNLDPEKLFAIIVLKNISPKAFSDLRKNDSVIASSIREIDNCRKLYIDNTEKELRFSDDELDKDLSVLDEIREKGISGYLNYQSAEQVNEFFEQIKRTYEAQCSSYLRFIIIQGYMDMTYRHYISHFYPGAISDNDWEFLRSVYERNELKYDFRIDDPEAVLSRLDDGLSIPTYIFNSTLLEYVIRKSPTTLLEMILPLKSGSQGVVRLEEILSSYSTETLGAFVDAINLATEFGKDELLPLMSLFGSECESNSKINIMLSARMLANASMDYNTLSSLVEFITDWEGLSQYLLTDDGVIVRRNLEELDLIPGNLIVEILNSDIDSDDKINIIDGCHKSIDIITDISKMVEIDDESEVDSNHDTKVIDNLFKYNLIDFTDDNIDLYLNFSDKMSDDFINYLNVNHQNYDTLSNEYKLKTRLLVDSRTDKDLFDKIVSDIQNDYDNYSQWMDINEKIIKTLEDERLISICDASIPVPFQSAGKKLIDGEYYKSFNNLVTSQPNVADKISLLCFLIDSCSDLYVVMDAIKLIPEVSAFADILDNKRPLIDNKYKKIVACKLIEKGMAKEWKYKNSRAIYFSAK